MTLSSPRKRVPTRFARTIYRRYLDTIGPITDLWMNSISSTILLATNNQHKAEELRAIFGDDPSISIITLAQLPVVPGEPEEDGYSLEDNAYIKALSAFQASGIASIADDTGLEVEALDGSPGIYSARYAGPNATYADNCDKLVKEMDGVSNRAARFRTVVCYHDGLRTIFGEGVIEGEILTNAQGEGGFGYDPLFQPVGFTDSFAEMTADQKNSISHRGRALRDLQNRLQSLRQ